MSDRTLPTGKTSAAALRGGARSDRGGGFLGRYGLWIFAIIVLIVAPQIMTTGFSRSLLSQIGISIIFALSYNMLLGQGGMLSFGHAVFYGLGGFVAIHVLNAISPEGFALPLELLPLAGGFGAMIFGAIFGWISTARAGTTFAMISLGIGELVYAGTSMFPELFGGESGISGNRVTHTGLFFNYGPQIDVYYLIAGWCLICTIAMYLLTRTPLGRMANAVRDNEERARFVGYDPRMVRFVQYTLASFFAGVAGGLTAVNYEIVTAENVSAVTSGSVLLMTFIGGVGNFAGPILGAILVTILQLSLSSITETWQLYFGVLFIVMVMFAPMGLAGIIALHEPIWQARRLNRLIVPYAIGLATFLLMGLGLVALIEMNYYMSTTYDASIPMELYGQEVSVQAVMPWLLAIAVTVVGGFLFRLAIRRIRHSWDGVIHDIKQEAA
ncbi:hypothetical protein GCM10011505_30750 [Tistrella bauzanensis]|uniref:Branched-chain amino acid ABC transporter permease n=1 Tax=Tistrella bauzanensis TaxID=657419 RepID=A0ABQ1IPB4_9PROT|nr:branched-chain amino acid ABC transporter permease [Tistrella bauzanensis]GGB47505.1 hypothetical protein GCM10011505_30750 [Tistrella bauzanensis]